MVDTGSSLNVLPKKDLAKLNCDGLILTPTDLIVRAFDGSKRAVFGEVELPVKIGPEVFKSTFYVMDIQPAYSCLLGRSWIHDAGAVTSTLHQKLKYIWEGQVVTVCGEEDIFVSHLSSFKYVEMDGEIWETPSQAFETVKVENALFAKEEEKPSIASYKQAAEVVKNGEAPGWGRMMDISAKKDRFGVGYQPGRGSSGQGRGRRTSVTFTSAGMLDPDHICMMSDEADSDCEIDRWIKPCAPGMGIQNWKAEKIIRVTLLEECDHSPDLIDNNPVTPSYDFDNPIYQAEEEGEEDCELLGELARLLKQEGKVIQPHEEQIEVVNLGTDEVKKEVKIGAALEESVKSRMVALLREYVDIFAWSYQDMPGLDTDIFMHKLPLRADCPPVKQKLRRTRPDMAMKIKEEVQKQWDAGFLAVTNYPPWVANIVPVPKKDGKVRKRQRLEKSSGTSTVPAIANGPTTVSSGITNSAPSSTVNVDRISPSDGGNVTVGKDFPSDSSDKDPVLVPSNDSRFPGAVGAIKREVGGQRPPTELNVANTSENKSSASETGSSFQGKNQRKSPAGLLQLVLVLCSVGVMFLLAADAVSNLWLVCAADVCRLPLAWEQLLS
ncbi:hypothetical protein KIW84_075058 [Lathyrus oleraceus]|uniref:Uncharacterized protein n=1 Tax=Pisum sativum TaxID=3888 RepID=A0A9D4VTY7_PEA|nr:hypothetical protein KIW84_075058 [Pisum sativum]